MRKLILVLLITWSASGPSTAQPAKIKMGQSFPDVPLPANTATGSIRVSDYKGKIVLLDVWTTWCTSCIEKMPLMHDLQKQYGSTLQIVLVNAGQKRAVVDKFLAKRANMPHARISLPVVFGDSALLKSLGVQSLPSYFLISADGVLRKRVESKDVNGDNIERFAATGKILKYETIKRQTFDSATSRKKLVWKSELVRGVVGEPTRLKFTDEGQSQAVCVNRSILDLYRFAFGTYHNGRVRSLTWVEPVPFNRTLFVSSDRADIGRYYQHDVRTDSTYSYRITAPPFTDWEKISEVMKDELENWFGYSAQMEKVKVKYYSLTVPDSTVFQNVTTEVYFEMNDTEIRIENMTIKQMLQDHRSGMFFSGRSFLSNYPIVDESGYKGRIGNINVTDIDTSDPESLESALKNTGIRLKLVEGELEMLVVRHAVEQ